MKTQQWYEALFENFGEKYITRYSLRERRENVIL